jgi:hypothetical protein
MVNSESSLLADDMMAVCGNCCETTWLCPRPNGEKVALDDGIGLGPIIIVEGKAYEVAGARGYRRHADRCTRNCKSAELPPPTSYVTGDDFLWP